VKDSLYEDHTRIAGKMGVHRGRDSDRATSLHHDRVTSRNTGNVSRTMHRGRTCTSKSDDFFGRQIVR
jgi:hypothetical protein